MLPPPTRFEKSLRQSLANKASHNENRVKLNSIAQTFILNQSHSMQTYSTRLSLLLQLRSTSDQIAWSRFVELYTPLVHRWVGDLSVADPDRSDIVQEVFVVLLRKLPDFVYEQDKSFRGWLRTITVNKTRDFLRRRNRLTEAKTLDDLEQGSTTESDLVAQKEYREFLLRSAMKLMKDHFSESTWRACWLHVAEGNSAKVVAAELQITENAVYLARGRVLKRLREELDGLWE